MQALPEDFGEMLLSVLEESDADEAAGLILQAAALSEPELEAFLDAFADRLRSSPAPLRAAELRAWLPGPPGAAAPRPPG